MGASLLGLTHEGIACRIQAAARMITAAAPSSRLAVSGNTRR